MANIEVVADIPELIKNNILKSYCSCGTKLQSRYIERGMCSTCYRKAHPEVIKPKNKVVYPTCSCGVALYKKERQDLGLCTRCQSSNYGYQYQKALVEKHIQNKDPGYENYRYWCDFQSQRLRRFNERRRALILENLKKIDPDVSALE